MDYVQVISIPRAREVSWINPRNVRRQAIRATSPSNIFHSIPLSYPYVVSASNVSAVQLIFSTFPHPSLSATSSSLPIPMILILLLYHSLSLSCCILILTTSLPHHNPILAATYLLFSTLLTLLISMS